MCIHFDDFKYPGVVESSSICSFPPKTFINCTFHGQMQDLRGGGGLGNCYTLKRSAFVCMHATFFCSFFKVGGGGASKGERGEGPMGPWIRPYIQ